MEDGAIKALRDLISDYRVEHRADAHQINERMTEILLLLKGHPDDKKNKGILARLESIEEWKEKVKSRDRKIAIWVSAVIAVGGAAWALFRGLQSIMK